MQEGANVSHEKKRKWDEDEKGAEDVDERGKQTKIQDEQGNVASVAAHYNKIQQV